MPPARAALSSLTRSGLPSPGRCGRIEIEIPFNAPSDRPCRIFVEDSPPGAIPDRQVIEFDTCDQYTIQGDLFSRAAMEDRPAPYPLEDSVKNMRVIDALFRSGATGAWVGIWGSVFASVFFCGLDGALRIPNRRIAVHL